MNIIIHVLHMVKNKESDKNPLEQVIYIYGKPTKRQVSKRQVYKTSVLKHPVSKYVSLPCQFSESLFL